MWSRRVFHEHKRCDEYHCTARHRLRRLCSHRCRARRAIIAPGKYRPLNVQPFGGARHAAAGAALGGGEEKWEEEEQSAANGEGERLDHGVAELVDDRNKEPDDRVAEQEPHRGGVVGIAREEGHARLGKAGRRTTWRTTGGAARVDARGKVQPTVDGCAKPIQQAVLRVEAKR